MKILNLHLGDEIRGCFEAPIQNNVLYLNKSFIIDEILIDNTKRICEIICNDRWQEIKLPIDNKIVKVKYHGILDGKSGLYPYVKENSKDEFYLLRHETIYYPSFYEIDSEEFLEHYLYPKTDDEFVVNIEIDDSRFIVSNLKQIDNNVYKGHNPVFVIGNYLLKDDYFGKLFYLIGHKEIDSKSLFIKKVNDALLKYKEVYLNNLKIVIIPIGYGSFVMPDNKTMFITEDSFDDPQYFIHELIHLHWNPKSKANVQKSRFFDEAITQYLTLRVLDELKIRCSEETERLFIDDFKTSVNSYDIVLQPICNFAEGNNGFLSYSYGPLSILQIEKKIGKEKVDSAFRKMINDDQLYDFTRFKSLFEDIEDVWNDCFATCNYQRYLMTRSS
ncbi:MAG: hypothetical protein MR210_04480 [Erysipelotrichaceae bacterium]|nr:hypothetical protein [Erysipelotrichaceae bacterium]MDY5251399.1 hypothetical protein [Erysipelotrichaceae bacterium]